VRRIVSGGGKEKEKALAASEYELERLEDGGVTLYFNPKDVIGWKDRLSESFGRYIGHVFPGATHEEAMACARDLHVFWVTKLPDDVSSQPYVPVTFQGTLHAGVIAWFRDRRPDLAAEEPAPGTFRLADTAPGAGEPGGEREQLNTFDPQGSILIDPNVGTLVLGSTVRARLEFTGEAVRRAFNYSSGSVFFDWSVRDVQGNEVLSGPLAEGYGDRVWELELDDAVLEAGERYTLSVKAASRWFRSGTFTPAPVTFVAVPEEQRAGEVFDLLLADPAQAAPFERVDGELRLKAGARAATVDEEIGNATFWLGVIKGLEDAGKISAEQAKKYRSLLTGRKEHLEEKRDLLRGATPYVAFGTLLDAESSAYMRLNIAVYGEERREGQTVRCILRLVDSTLAADDPPVYETEAGREAADVSPAALAAASQAAEAAAFTALLDKWQSLNNYPDGKVDLAVRLADGGVRRLSTTTRNLRKPVKRNAGRVAMVAGGVALGASLYTGGTTAPAGVALVEGGAALLAAGATLTDVALRVEERVKTSTLRADSQLALDAMQVASLALGGWGQLMKNARPVGKGFVLASVGLDAGQLVVMNAQVRQQIRGIELRYEQRMQGAGDEQRRKLEQQRDDEISAAMGEAVVSSGISIVAVGKGVADLASLPAHAPAGGKPPVHEGGSAPPPPPPPVHEAPPPAPAPPPAIHPPVEAPAPAPAAVKAPEPAPVAPVKVEAPEAPAPTPSPEAPAPEAPAPQPVYKAPELTAPAPAPVQAKLLKPVKPGELRHAHDTHLRREAAHPTSEVRRAAAAESTEKLAALDRRYREVEKVTRQLEEAERVAKLPPQPGEAPVVFDEKAHQAAVALNEAERVKIMTEAGPLAGALRKQASEALAADLGGTAEQIHGLLEELHPAAVRGLHHELGGERFTKLLDAGPERVGAYIEMHRETALVPAARERLLEILDAHKSGALDEAGLGQALGESRDFLNDFPNGVKGDFRRMAAGSDPTAKVSPVEALPTQELFARAQAGDVEAAHELDLRQRSLGSASLQTAAQQAEESAKLARKAGAKLDAKRFRAQQERLRSILGLRNPLLEGQAATQGPFTQRPEMRATLEEDIKKSRVVRRVDIPVSDDAVVGGTVGAARTDIPGIDPDKPTIGRSPLAHGPKEASTINPRYQSPADTVAAKGHAEQTLTGNLANEIDQLIADGKLTQGDLKGKTVWMLIDQEVCSYCASGLDSPVAPGVLAQFSQEYPLLTIQIKNLRTSDLLILQGGRKINP
jgi:hypothetical protein